MKVVLNVFEGLFFIFFCVFVFGFVGVGLNLGMGLERGRECVV